MTYVGPAELFIAALPNSGLELSVAPEATKNGLGEPWEGWWMAGALQIGPRGLRVTCMDRGAGACRKRNKGWLYEPKTRALFPIM